MWVKGVVGLATSYTVSRVFLDTNVLVYGLDDSSPVKQRIAREVQANAENRYVISTQVLLELHAVLARKFSPPMTLERIERVIRRLTDLDVVPADADLVLRAMTTARGHQLSIWDAMIVEAAHVSNCAELWTEDLSPGSTIRGVRIVNPFAA